MAQKVVVVEVVSKETIKPASPTPHHLRSFKLSLIDQLSPLIYVRTILFYDGIHDHDQVHRSNLLKRSLSETLTRFYPVAGRIKDNIWVDCNDEGVDYFEARVNVKMSDFLSRLDDEYVFHHQLVPVPFHKEATNINNLVYKEPLLVVQVNMFDCGGTAITVCISHKIADASTMTTFINGWAAINASCRGTMEIACPTFDSASLFPANKLLSSPDPVQEVGGISTGKNVVTKRFVFDASKIAELRARIAATSSTTMKNYPTRVEVVSALIWKSAMEVSRVKSPSSSLKPISSVLKHVVNLRPKINPPLPKVSFGNIVTVATAEWTTTPGVALELDELVGQLRLGISKINGDYIKKLQGYDAFLSSVEESCRLKEEKMVEEVVEVYWMSSWCRFPLYETDFGWGKPIWISSGTTKNYKNGVLLLDTRCGDGIEALVSLEEEDMAIFQHDQELLQFLSHD